MHMNDFTLSPFLLTPDGDHHHCELSLQSSPIRHYMVRMSLMFLLLLCTMTTFAQQVEVTLTEAGTLSEKIASDQKFEISSLKVSGPINGTDVRYLREMAGQTSYGKNTDGKLVDLDLTDARIVQGGLFYYYGGPYTNGHNTSYYTKDEEFGDYMFYNCSNLTCIKLPSLVTSIGEHALYGCSSLTSVMIPTSVTSIGENAFYKCSNLAEVTIGTGIKKINDYTFSGCSSLADISIPQNVDSIGNYVFGGCKAMEKFTIADRNTELSMGYNGNNEPMFKDCPLKSVYIGGNITYPTSQKEGYSPFYHNTSLETVEITDKETEISENEFYGCTSLKDVTIGDGIEKIGYYAFSGCSSLESFSFGTSLKTIGEEAFSDCTAMTKLVAKTHEPPVCDSQALDDINKWECKLYVPVGREDVYKAADQWKQFFFIDGSIETGIEKIEKDENMRDAQYYGLDGNKQAHLQKGVNIVRMSDGTTRKVIVK